MMRRRIYSKGCKCEPKCLVDVSVWCGDDAYHCDDPHECGDCWRRFKRKLDRYVSGIYTCGKEDCFKARLKYISTSLIGKFLAPAEKQLSKADAKAYTNVRHKLFKPLKRAGRA